VQIVEQLQVLPLRNPGDLILYQGPFPLIQSAAAFAGIARLEGTDGVVGNIRTTAGSQQDVLNGQRAFYSAADAFIWFLVLPQSFPDC
jgi:hypothetical protein